MHTIILADKAGTRWRKKARNSNGKPGARVYGTLIFLMFLSPLFLFLFQNVLFSIGSAFLYYVNHFKLYSSFCASHSKAQKALHPSKFSIRHFTEIKVQKIAKIKHYSVISSRRWESGPARVPALPEPAAAALHGTGVLPDQAYSEDPQISPASATAQKSHAPRLGRTATPRRSPDRYEYARVIEKYLGGGKFEKMSPNICTKI